MMNINRQAFAVYYHESGRKGRSAMELANADMAKRREQGWKAIAFHVLSNTNDGAIHVLYEEIDPSKSSQHNQ